MTTEQPSPSSSLTPTLEEIISKRHSSRLFLSTPVPRSIIQTALELAQLAPSNSNIQPWHFVIVSGNRLEKLKTALYDAASRSTPNIPPLPEGFSHFRSALGKMVYGVGMGIARGDSESRRKAVLRNYEFFNAPTAGILCMDKQLGLADAVSVGMYLQTFLLEVTKLGLGSCVEVSVAGYPKVLKKELGIEERWEVLCGVAVGYEDEEYGANKLKIERDGVDKNVVFLED